MRQWSQPDGSPGAIICQGLVDEYPLPAHDPQVEITPVDVHRWLGIELSAAEEAELLQRLDFTVQLKGESVQAQAPDHRLDISEGINGIADIMEELARIYGYERIPETRMADELPPPHASTPLELEERVRDLLVELGMQEIAAYRLTSPERESRRLPAGSPPDDLPYVRLSNPIASDRIVLRHSLLAGLLEVVERNVRLRERQALFEIGPVYLLSEDVVLPDEQPRLAMVLTGRREPVSWKAADDTANIVHPPVTDTGWVTPAVAQAVAEADDMFHVATPEQVAEVVRFLCSDEAALVTGNVLRLR